VIVLGSRAAGKRASRVSRGALFFLSFKSHLSQTSGPAGPGFSVHIDINADVGEAATPFEELVELALANQVSSINIACGAHAGDSAAMRRLVAVAVARGLAIGAHPGYADPLYKGRRPLALPPEAVRGLVRDQVASLAAVAADRGARIGHVKPHGALYNQAATDRGLADAIALGVRDVDPSLRLVGLCRSAMLDAAVAAGLTVSAEAFVDRAYRADGSLVPRKQPGAVHSDAAVAVTQALTMLLTGFVRANDGVTRVPIKPDTLCIHADTPGAVALARRLRAALAEKGIVVARAS
jgi:5-oxoprolinase (ATP-hydrolysing) subunit A